MGDFKYAANIGLVHWL